MLTLCHTIVASKYISLETNWPLFPSREFSYSQPWKNCSIFSLLWKYISTFRGQLAVVRQTRRTRLGSYIVITQHSHILIVKKKITDIIKDESEFHHSRGEWGNVWALKDISSLKQFIWKINTFFASHTLGVRLSNNNKSSQHKNICVKYIPNCQ